MVAAALTLCLTAACVPAGRAPVAAGAASGIQTVGLDGQGFAVVLAPGGAGTALGASGAVRVQGQSVSVTRQAPALGQADGAIAKRAAVAGCRQAGGRPNGSALGRYAGQGLWVFAGGCA